MVILSLRSFIASLIWSVPSGSRSPRTIPVCRTARVFSLQLCSNSALMHILRKGGKVTVSGEHDINTKWLSEMKSVPTCPHRVKRDRAGGFGRTQIVPRFLIEGWSREEFGQLFNPQHTFGDEVIQTVLVFLRKHNFDGMVLDSGHINLRVPHRDAIIAFFNRWGDALRADGKLFILVIPVRPPISSTPRSKLLYLRNTSCSLLSILTPLF